MILLFCRKILSFALVILAALAMTELALWAFWPLPYGEERKMTLHQELAGLKSDVVYEQDRHGLRARSDFSRLKDARVIRVLAIGASTTQQMNQNFEDTWPAILEKLLQDEWASKGVQVEVAAWGRGGQRVFDRVNFVRRQAAAFKPDVIVTLEGINDLAWNGGPGYEYKGPESRLEDIQDSPVVKLQRFKRAYCQIYKRLKLRESQTKLQMQIAEGRAIENFTASLDENHRKYLTLPYIGQPARDPDPIVEFKDGIVHLVKSIQEIGAEPVLLAQPVIWRDIMDSKDKEGLWFYVDTPNGPIRTDISWMYKEISAYNATQKEAAQLQGATYVALDERIPPTREYFFDDCHVTDLGSRMMAQMVLAEVSGAIRRKVQARNLLGTPADSL